MFSGQPAVVPAVQIILVNPSTRPGLTLTGQVVVGADVDLLIGRIAVGLVAAVCEPGSRVAGLSAGGVEVGDLRAGASVPVALTQPALAATSVVPAGQRRNFAFSVPVPWQAPVTHLRGRPLPGMAVGVGAELVVGELTTRVDPVPVYVHPLPAQERVFDLFTELGFRIRNAVVEHGRIRGVHQTLPFYQEVGFWAAPQYAGVITEASLTFLAGPDGMEAILGLDRWIGVLGGAHSSVARLPIRYDAAHREGWPSTVEEWVREALKRHAAAAAGHRASSRGRAPRVRQTPGPVPGRGLEGAGGENHDGGDGN